MTKIVCINPQGLTHAQVFETGPEPLGRLLSAVKALAPDVIVATGYGRHLAQANLPCMTLAEIRACARAARYLAPDCDSVIDIGGQDAKAVEVPADGDFGRFEMNDRCAAGTGRFLEVMAGALGYTVESFGAEALQADRPAQVNSMCTVFAESEVVSLIARGEDRRRIALGLHAATARRVAAMASRVSLGERTLFVGGVAQNPCMVRCLQDELPCVLVVPPDPQTAVALGAALVGLEQLQGVALGIRADSCEPMSGRPIRQSGPP
jgi:predicted CoA-substrate-specific enzyme activase